VQAIQGLQGFFGSPLPALSPLFPDPFLPLPDILQAGGGMPQRRYDIEKYTLTWCSLFSGFFQSSSSADHLQFLVVVTTAAEDTILDGQSPVDKISLRYFFLFIL